MANIDIEKRINALDPKALYEFCSKCRRPDCPATGCMEYVNFLKERQRAMQGVKKPPKMATLRVTIGGVTKTVSEWAPEFGLDEIQVIRRLWKGWDPVRALKTPITCRPVRRLFPYKGQMLSMDSVADLAGVTRASLYYWLIRKGLPVGEALEKARNGESRLYAEGGERHDV